MTLATRLYVGAIIAGGAVTLGMQMPREIANPGLAITLLAAMVVASLFKLRLPLGSGVATLSMASVVDFMGLVSIGVDAAMVIAAVGVAVQCLARVRRRQPWYRTAFSVAAVVLAVQAAGWSWQALGGTIADAGLAMTLLPLVVAAIVYFAVNSGLIAGAIALSAGVSPVRYWTRAFVRTAPAYLVAGISVATMHMLLTGDVYVALPAVAVPMIACHLAYAYWLRQAAARRQTSPVLT